MDVLIIGAGPAGCTAAAILAQGGFKCLVVEKLEFPRFVIGESLLPSCLDHLDRIGALDKCRRVGFQYKNGARFIRNNEISEFDFSEQYFKGQVHAWQVKRAEFDAMLADHIQSLGIKIWFNCAVKGIELKEVSQLVLLANPEREFAIESRFIIDASGYGRVIPRIFDLNMPSSLKAKSAFFAHIRSEALWGWIDEHKVNYIIGPGSSYVWIIPFADKTISVGVVDNDESFPDMQTEEDIHNLLNRFPPLQELLSRDFNQVMPARMIRGFSIGIKKFYGNGYVLAGNTTEFLDPVFSSGVSIAMESAARAADLVAAHLNGGHVNWKDDYEEYMRGGIDVFKSFVESWYSGELIDILFHDNKPQSLKEQLCSVLV